MIQTLPIPSSIYSVDQAGDTPPSDQPQTTWKRWAVRILPKVVATVSAAFALSAVFAGLFTTAAVFGTITVLSTTRTFAPLSHHGPPPSYAPPLTPTTPSTLSHVIDIPSEILSHQPESTSSIVYSQGYEVVDVPGDGNCFFHAALVQSEQGPGWNAHTLRQQVHEEARQWLYEYETNLFLSRHECESWQNPVAEEDLYTYLTNNSEHNTITGLEAIKRDGVWMYTVIVPLVARVLQKPIITVNDSGSIMNVVDTRGFYVPIIDNQLKNLDLNSLGNFVLLEHVNNNHFRGCRKREYHPIPQVRIG
ncbi:hypothetical protein [Endozoicomonas sp. SCSIO W0465]|uniref:hypothetical protein n=1 Tax=Endozoicomonas sp. SCSIO W0465 TaxID=2918516 RepID=UPI002074B09D|nr:hypothetical protein [Endozoicomonas sp. SCSIO W0465]USE34745.1 hypothetical protein MJO57_21825 [Endozoicomonas sp. SCSIO W0465]